MPSNEVPVVDDLFQTANEQLRKVTKVETDSEGRTRVSYVAKSAKIPGRNFEPGHTLAKPPLLEDFLSQCNQKLGEEDLRDLKARGILP